MNINSLTPQQRQLLMMQHQQQQMRPGGGGNGNNGASPTINAEMYGQMQQAQERAQQRMSQAGSPANAGSSPMSGFNDGNAFPALRSNQAISDIARSTRSPSDGAASPMSPHVGRIQPDMRRMVSGGMPGGMPTGFNQQMPNWQQKNQQQQSMPMTMQAPNYGVQPSAPGSNSYGGAGQNWGANQYPMTVPSPGSAGGYQPERTRTPRQSSSTPGPQMQPQSQANSPPVQPEFEFNW